MNGDLAIHLKTIYLTHFYLETGNCHGRIRVKVRVSVWVIPSYDWSRNRVKKSHEMKCLEVNAKLFMLKIKIHTVFCLFSSAKFNWEIGLLDFLNSGKLPISECVHTFKFYVKMLINSCENLHIKTGRF